MANNVTNVGFSDYAADAADIERRRKMAELLQAEGAKGMGGTEMVGGWAIPKSPWEGVGKAAQQLSGAYQQNQLKAESKALTDRAQAEAMQWYGAMPQGTPAQIQDTSGQGTGSFDMSGTAGPQNTPGAAPTQQEQMAWLLKGQSNPVSSGVAQMMLAQQLKQQEPYTLAEGAMRIGPNNQILRENPKDFRAQQQNPSDLDRLLREKAALPPGDPRSAIYDNAIRKQSETAKQITNVNQSAPVTPVTIQDPKDPNKTIIVDGRTGALIGAGPKLTQTGTLENKRQFNMQGIGSTIQEAEDLLSGKATGTKPTGSGIGTAVDMAGSFIGRSPAGSVEAAKLKSVGGALVSKMPRMEGPQSDRDVMLYKEMAGKIGDSTVPVEQRQAALETVKGLWSKYEKINPDAFQGGAPAAAAPKIDALLDKYK